MTLVPRKVAFDGNVVDSSVRTLEECIMGGIAEEIVRGIFWKSRIVLKAKPRKDNKVDFAAMGKKRGRTPDWWNIEIKTRHEARLPMSYVEEKPELRLLWSKIILVSREAPPFIRVLTAPFTPDPSGMLNFDQPLSEDPEFVFDEAVYRYYEERARILLTVARLTRNGGELQRLTEMVSRVREDAPEYEAPGG